MTKNSQFDSEKGTPGAGKNLHHVDFFCRAPAAKSVCLVGDFNAWQVSAHPMRRMPDGDWMIGLELPHGHHQYLFLVDGQASLDPNATGTVATKDGKTVSLIAVS